MIFLFVWNFNPFKLAPERFVYKGDGRSLPQTNFLREMIVALTLKACKGFTFTCNIESLRTFVEYNIWSASASRYSEDHNVKNRVLTHKYSRVGYRLMGAMRLSCYSEVIGEEN